MPRLLPTVSCQSFGVMEFSKADALIVRWFSCSGLCRCYDMWSPPDVRGENEMPIKWTMTVARKPSVHTLLYCMRHLPEDHAVYEYWILVFLINNLKRLRFLNLGSESGLSTFGGRHISSYGFPIRCHCVAAGQEERFFAAEWKVGISSPWCISPHSIESAILAGEKGAKTYDIWTCRDIQRHNKWTQPHFTPSEKEKDSFPKNCMFEGIFSTSILREIRRREG